MMAGVAELDGKETSWVEIVDGYLERFLEGMLEV